MLSTLIIFLVVGILVIPLMCLFPANNKSSGERSVADIMQELDDEGFDAEDLDDDDIDEIKEILREYDFDEDVLDEIDDALLDEDSDEYDKA